MPSTYSGAWLRGAYVEPDAATVHVADPAHGDTTTTNERLAEGYSAPPMTEAGTSYEFPGLDYIVQTTGVVLDRTDYETHDAADHAGGPDEGAATAMTRGQGATTFHDEKYRSARFQGLPQQNVSTVALQRGLNSLPQNNPDGVNPGHVEQHWIDREFAVGKRVHDQRVAQINTAATDTDVPPPPGGSPWTSPFSSGARAFTRGFNRPELRREPPPMADGLITDPVTEYPQLSPWVVI